MAKVKLRVCKELARAEVVDGVLTAEENGVAVEIEMIGEIWDGLSTTLVCRGGGQERKMLIQDGKSIVPWECLIGREMLYMGVDGWNEDGIHIPSSFAEVQLVLGSVAETEAIPGNPPSPDIAAQIIIVMEGLDERIKALEQGGGSGAVTSVNGKTGDVELTAEDVGALSTDDAEILAKKVNGKMVKHILEYDGTHIKEDGENLTFAVLYEMLMEKPDFCVLVYNNFAYHPNGVSTSQIVFSSEYPVNGYDRAHRITMLANGTVTATETESEHTSSRVNAITEDNEGSTVQYPSVKATADYVKPIKQGLSQCLKTPAKANVGQMFVVKSKNADGSVVLEAVDTPSGGLDTVPSHWPTWTAEEQLAGRQRLGLPGKYELIETRTLADDSTNVVFSAEPDGTPYKFREVTIFLQGNGALAAEVSVGIAINDRFSYANTIIRYSIPTTNGHVCAKFTAKNTNGMITGQLVTDQYTTSLFSNNGATAIESTKIVLSDYITSVGLCAYRDRSLKAGVTVTVYALR